MARQNLTEGARRAVENARRHATAWQHPQVLPAHLLWALLDEESYAFELLTGVGLRQPLLRREDIWHGEPPGVSDQSAADTLSSAPGSPDPEDDPTGARRDDPADEEAEAAEAELDAPTRDVFEALAAGPETRIAGEPVSGSGPLQDTFERAGQFARGEGVDVEISSEHLLAALLESDSPVSVCLQEFGFSGQSFQFRSRSARQYAEPMPVSFEIDQSAESPGEKAVVYRILDAAANRAREGLRVVEDFVRFSLDDAHLSRLLKTARHQLGAVLQELDTRPLVAARDTRHDVGTRISTDTELRRSSPLAVVQASLKRVQESVRTLEEYSKVLPVRRESPGDASVSQRLETLRYELYTLEKAILTSTDRQSRLAACSVYLLLTSELCGGDWETVLKEAMSAGIRLVQIREKSMSDRELLDHARAVRRITRECDVLLIINDRPDLAVLCDADGVHVGQDELTVHEARRIAGPDRLVGVSTHSIDQARQAVLNGASYLGVGPVFPSGTKSFEEFAGLDLVNEVAAEISLPWFAIGGIDGSNVDEVIEAGAGRIAVTGAVCRAAEPRSVAVELIERSRREPE